jgi:hypothetical protein
MLKRRAVNQRMVGGASSPAPILEMCHERYYDIVEKYL